MIEIGHGVRIDPDELEFSYSRSSGPGGQHVNKVESRVTLRFDVEGSDSLDERTRARLLRALDARINRDGELVLHCQVHRSRHRNREELLVRFRDLVERAVRPRKKRRKTRPGRAAKERRLKQKRERGEVKRRRRRPSHDG